MVIYCYLIHWFTPTDRRPPNHRLNSANKMHQSGNHFNYSLIRFDFNVNFMLTERIRLSAFVYQTVLFIGYSLSLEPTRECWNDQQMVKHKQFQWIIDCELCCVALRVWIGMSIHISESLLKNCWWNRIEQKEKISHQTHWNCMNMKYTGNSKAIDRWSTLHSQFQTKDLSIGFSIHFFCTIQNYAKLFKQMTKKKQKAPPNLFLFAWMFLFCAAIYLWFDFCSVWTKQKAANNEIKEKKIWKTRIVQYDEHTGSTQTQITTKW